MMKTQTIFFPFDLFGHAGARQGAELLADAVREMLADNRREKTPTRARSYTNKVEIDELVLDALDDYADWLPNARDAIAKVLADGDFLLWSTGNHLGALPLYDVLAQSPEKTLVIQFDAHLDIYDLADCTRELSHGNFLRHVDGPLPAIINLGHREQVLKPSAIEAFFRRAISAAEVQADVARVVDLLRRELDAADRVIIDLDCDVFDAAYFPATLQHEPFGLSPASVLGIMREIWSPKILGFAISEFVPAHDHRDRSLATLLWLVEWVLLRNHEKPLRG